MYWSRSGPNLHRPVVAGRSKLADPLSASFHVGRLMVLHWPGNTTLLVPLCSLCFQSEFTTAALRPISRDWIQAQMINQLHHAKEYGLKVSNRAIVSNQKHGDDRRHDAEVGDIVCARSGCDALVH